MKAIDIINFINEDKFSKYTLKQIYDELGNEDFMDYLAQICTKIIRNLKSETNLLKNVKPDIDHNFGLSYYGSKGSLREKFIYEKLIIGDNGGHYPFMTTFIIQYVIEVPRREMKRVSFLFSCEETNIVPFLTREITDLYNTPTVVKERKYGAKYVNAST